MECRPPSPPYIVNRIPYGPALDAANPPPRSPNRKPGVSWGSYRNLDFVDNCTICRCIAALDLIFPRRFEPWSQRKEDFTARPALTNKHFKLRVLIALLDVINLKHIFSFRHKYLDIRCDSTGQPK